MCKRVGTYTIFSSRLILTFTRLYTFVFAELISGPTSTETLAMQDHSGTSEDQVPVKNSPQRPVRLDILPPPPLNPKAGNANGMRRSPMVSTLYVGQKSTLKYLTSLLFANSLPIFLLAIVSSAPGVLRVDEVTLQSADDSCMLVLMHAFRSLSEWR